MRYHIRFLLVFVICLSLAGLVPGLAFAADVTVRGFLEAHCLRCHGSTKQEADVRFDTLAAPTTENDLSDVWSRIVEMIESGEMPPEEEPRPDGAAAKMVVQKINQVIVGTAADRPLALRRMNRREYENTMHDLLGIDVPLADLLPEDGSVQGFDNVADGLSISSILMEQYLEAANVAFDAVIRRIEPLPVETRRAELMKIQENIDSVKGKKGGVIEIANSFVKFTPGWPPARVDTAHPIEDGVYRCRIAVWPQVQGAARSQLQFTSALFSDLRHSSSWVSTM